MRGAGLPLLAFALVLGAVAFAEQSAPEPAGLWSGPINAPVPRTLAGGTVIDAKRVHALIARSAAPARRSLLIDVSNETKRPDRMAPGSPWMPLPHQSIPSSIWLPGAGMAEISAELAAKYERILSEATGGDRARPIIVYCHERCWLSWNAAKRAIGYGYTRVYWLAGGIEAWRAAHYPTQVVTPQ